MPSSVQPNLVHRATVDVVSAKINTILVDDATLTFIWTGNLEAFYFSPLNQSTKINLIGCDIIVY